MKRIVTTLLALTSLLVASANFQPLADTNQTKCYDTQGNQISCTNAGQDGSYQGLEPSFTAHNFNNTTETVIIDKNTNLMWTPTMDTNNDGQIDTIDELNWTQAQNFCANLTYSGFNDWRLPNVIEWVSIWHQTNTDDKTYWTAQKLADDPSFAYCTSMMTPSTSGYVAYKNVGYTFYVKCVRGEPPTVLGDLVDNNDKTITDKSTGLIWMRASADINNDNRQDIKDAVSWQDAINYCENLTLAGYNDWRLPNVKELATLLNLSQVPAKYMSGIVSGPHWSSTTHGNYHDLAQFVNFQLSVTSPDITAIANSAKSTGYFVLCVRGGIPGAKNRLTVEFAAGNDQKGTVTSNPAGITCSSGSCSHDFSIYPDFPTITLTATPKSGYAFAGWGGDCSSCNASTTCQVPLYGTRLCIVAFKQASSTTFTVTPSVGNGQGTIAPNSPQQVASGQTTSFTLTPASCYHIDNVGGTCGGSLNGNTYTTSAITKDCSVVANFAIDSYTISASAGVGGSITPSGSIKADCGSNKTFTITPNIGFVVDKVIVDGQDKGAINSFTFSNIDKDHTISVTFKPQGGSTQDYDNDDIGDAEEDGVENAKNQNRGDGNGDDILDKTQSEVTSFKNYDDTIYFTLESKIAGASQVFLQNYDIQPIAPVAGTPANVTFPYGMISFKVTNFVEGTTIQVRLFLPKDPRISGYWKKNTQTGKWENIAKKVEHGPSYAPNKTVITFELTDGGVYDADGNANSVIDDPGGPGMQTTSTPEVTVPAIGGKGLLLLAFLILLISLNRINALVTPKD